MLICFTLVKYHEKRIAQPQTYTQIHSSFSVARKDELFPKVKNVAVYQF